MTDDEMLSLLMRVGMRLRSRWEEAVSGTQIRGMAYPLTSTTYRAAIAGPVRSGAMSVRVSTSYSFARRIEAGHPAIDLKSYLLRSAKAKSGRRGAYIDVPFIWKTGGMGQGQTLPDVGLRPLDLPHTALTRRRGQGNGAVTSREGKRALGYKGTDVANWGRRTQLGKTDVVASFGRGSVPSYTQKSGHLAGMRRTTTGGVTFRRISTRSAPGSWVLPAKPPNPIRAAVVSDVLRGG
jgi:hypothetical protein